MKDRLRDIIIGILTSTVMIFIGYNLNDYLAKERISIEHVEFLPEMNVLSRNPQIFSHLINSQQFTTWLFYLQTTAVQNLFSSPNMKGTYSPSEVKTLITSTKEFINFLHKDSEDCRVLENKLKDYQVLFYKNILSGKD